MQKSLGGKGCVVVVLIARQGECFETCAYAFHRVALAEKGEGDAELGAKVSVAS